MDRRKKVETRGCARRDDSAPGQSEEESMTKVVRLTAVAMISLLFSAMQCWAGQIEVVKPEKAGMSISHSWNP